MYPLVVVGMGGYCGHGGVVVAKSLVCVVLVFVSDLIWVSFAVSAIILRSSFISLELLVLVER